MNDRRACRQFPLSTVMLNRKPCAAAGRCLVIAACLINCLITTALPGPLPGDSTRQGDTTSRFVVSFAEEHKQAVRQHLTQMGYKIISEGIGFYAITNHGTVRTTPTTAGVTQAPAAAAAAGASSQSAASAASYASKETPRGRKLIQQRQQQHVQALLALRGVPGAAHVQCCVLAADARCWLCASLGVLVCYASSWMQVLPVSMHQSLATERAVWCMPACCQLVASNEVNTQTPTQERCATSNAYTTRSARSSDFRRLAGNAHAGVSSSEQDVRRFLHLQPSRGHSLSSAASAARRRLRAASISSMNAGAAAAASPASKLAGYWHTSSSFRPSQYDIWGNSIGDQQCASNDTQLADAAGAEVLPWGIKAIGATNETLLKAQSKGRAIVCIIDSGLARDHPEYKNFPGQLSGCQVGTNCPFEWSKDIVGHGTHVAGGLHVLDCSANQLHVKVDRCDGCSRHCVGGSTLQQHGSGCHVSDCSSTASDPASDQQVYKAATDFEMCARPLGL